MLQSKGFTSTGRFWFHAFMIVFGLAMIYPVLWLFLAAFRDNVDLATRPAALFPAALTFENFLSGWQGFGGNSFGLFLKNSLFLSGLSTLFQVASSTFVGFGFARTEFKGRKLLFSVMIVTMLLPAQVLLVPQYIVMNKLGWINTYLPLIVPTLAGLPFFIFMVMQFITGIPIELDEAAEIDGCNKFAIFFRIILPLLKPVIITECIFSFYWKWQEFLGPMMYLQKAEMYTIQVALNMFTDPAAMTNWGAIYAMSIVSILPVFIIFLSAQKYLVEGIATTGLKG